MGSFEKVNLSEGLEITDKKARKKDKDLNDAYGVLMG